MDFDQEVDARGLKCPLPILRTKKMLAQMMPGQIVRVWATDAGSNQDFPDFARHTHNILLQQQQREDGVFEFFLQKKITDNDNC